MYILDNFFYFILYLQLRKDASVQLILIHATVFECFLTSYLPVSFISLRQQQNGLLAKLTQTERSTRQVVSRTIYCVHWFDVVSSILGALTLSSSIQFRFSKMPD